MGKFLDREKFLNPEGQGSVHRQTLKRPAAQKQNPLKGLKDRIFVS
jgi:hypothetical protein